MSTAYASGISAHEAPAASQTTAVTPSSRTPAPPRATGTAGASNP
ncbi:hypothetical protein [Rhizomonospora bruguierae]|nr:hypothetical protein [Micromonospora sp. NBRC 107566]